jgi:hypothetical protein
MRKESGQKHHTRIENGGKAQNIIGNGAREFRGNEAYVIRGKVKDLSVTEIQRVWRGHRARAFYRVLNTIHDMSGGYHN